MQKSLKSLAKMSRTRKLVAALPLALAATGAFAGVVGTLPEPTVVDGKNVYTLGTSTSDAIPTRENAEANYDYIDWASLSVPAGSVVKLNGAVVLDALPEDVTYDWIACTRIAYVGTSFATAGKKVTVPATATALFYTSTVTKSEDGTSFSLSSDKNSTIQADVEINGELPVPGGYQPRFQGSVTGTGAMDLNGFGTSLGFYGSLSFSGSVAFGASQEAETIRITSTEGVSSLGVVKSSYLPAKPAGSGPNAVFFTPQDEAGASHELTIGELYLCGWTSRGGGVDVIGGNSLRTETGFARRWGVQLVTYGNDTIRVKNITGQDIPCLGLFADENVSYKVDAEEPKFDKGLGNFIIEGNQSTEAFIISPMANVTLTGYHGNYAANRYFFYTAESSVVNRAQILDFSGIGGSGFDLGHEHWRVMGYSPASLPQKIVNHKGRPDRINIYLSDSEWTMPFDFGAEDVNPARCETDCRYLHVAAKGTVYVRNNTTAAHAAYPSEWTEYPVITTYAGGAPTNEKGESVFNDWTIVPVGKWGQVQIEKVVKDTGLYLRMRRENAFHIIIR